MIKKYRAILSAQGWSKHTMLDCTLQEWLLYTGSLTQKLQQLCPMLKVEIIDEGWRDGANFTKTVGACWQREVILGCGQQPWIFAQTLLPQSTIENVAQAVPTLGKQPIGLWLFPQNPERLSLEWRQDMETGLYARRSVFNLKGYPLEIRELFLPALEQYLSAYNH